LILIVKKETDRFKDEYEAALKRDKELEKSFRKEFSHYELQFDALLKLYKLRKRVFFLF
jgi:hypothetical protein